MRTLIGVAVAAGLAVVGLGFWLNPATQPTTKIATAASLISSSVPKPTTESMISIWEIHNQAHLEFLPVEQFEDQTLIFTEANSDSGPPPR